MSPIKKVQGTALLPALLEAGFKSTSFASSGRKGAVFPNVRVKTVDYTDVAAFTKAFDNHDAVVEAFNPAAATHQVHTLEAVLAVGVRHIISSDFSGKTSNPSAKNIVIFNPKLAAQQRAVAESEGKLTWTVVVSGPWYDWTVGKGIFRTNKRALTITRYGSGDQNRHAFDGEALAAVLSDPENYRNRPVYFANHTVSTNQLISVVHKLGLTEAHSMCKEDTEMGFEDRLNSNAYAALATFGNSYGSDFGDKVEPGWGESEEAYVVNLLKRLFT
ncbi:hypothetical protein LZ30DRAFT_752258 [Colletotrichum cereale]|nr:hypothetical protein LZ30DRAFT_752258 [Colletotrichum cereale]